MPWHLIMILQHGEEFINRYVYYDLFKRATSGIEGNVGSTHFYLQTLQQRLTPWALLVPAAVAYSIRDAASESYRGVTLLCFGAVTFTLYSVFVETKTHQYILPLIPVLAILIGALLSKALTGRPTIAYGFILVALLIALALLPFRAKIVAVSLASIPVVLTAAWMANRPSIVALSGNVNGLGQLVCWVASLWTNSFGNLLRNPADTDLEVVATAARQHAGGYCLDWLFLPTGALA